MRLRDASKMDDNAAAQFSILRLLHVTKFLWFWWVTHFCGNIFLSKFMHFLQHFWDWKAESANFFDVWLKGWCRSSGWVTLIFIPVHSGEIFSDPRKQANPVVVDLERKMTRRWLYSWNNINQLAKLGDAIAISNLKLSMTHSLTHCTDWQG